MNKKDKQIYKNRYEQRLKKYGYSPKALGWGKNGRENIRFKILTQIGICKNSSILDVGCGFGDYHNFLKSNCWDGRYLGIDINGSLLEVARKQFVNINVKELDILESEIEQKYDFVMGSGIFNAKLHHEDNNKYIEKMLSKMYDISNYGVAVDFMSSYVDFQHKDAFHASPENIFMFGRTLTNRLTIRNDYMPFEFVLYLYKDDSVDRDNTFEELSDPALNDKDRLGPVFG